MPAIFEPEMCSSFALLCRATTTNVYGGMTAATALPHCALYVRMSSTLERISLKSYRVDSGLRA